jgi:hypothetical protein
MEPKPEWYTVARLFRFWKRHAPQHGVNPHTANAIRVACMRVFSVLPTNAENVDLRTIGPVDSLLQRFEDEHEGKLARETIEAYKTRFRYGLESYLSFLKDPHGWDPGFTPRERMSADPSHGGWGHDAPAASALTHRFPLRKDYDAVFTLPRDLSSAEVSKLSAYLATLAVDFGESRNSA